jgi:hypothetical protein
MLNPSTSVLVWSEPESRFKRGEIQLDFMQKVSTIQLRQVGHADYEGDLLASLATDVIFVDKSCIFNKLV